ncbi:hypothetical protein D3C76_1577730 [compost metagenome]
MAKAGVMEIARMGVEKLLSCTFGNACGICILDEGLKQDAEVIGGYEWKRSRMMCVGLFIWLMEVIGIVTTWCKVKGCLKPMLA